LLKKFEDEIERGKKKMKFKIIIIKKNKGIKHEWKRIC
jgi:hypothetical protein